VAICGAGGRPTSRVDHDVKPISFFLKRQMIKKPYMLYADRHIRFMKSDRPPNEARQGSISNSMLLLNWRMA
jgi:hypothetical protein